MALTEVSTRWTTVKLLFTAGELHIVPCVYHSYLAFFTFGLEKIMQYLLMEAVHLPS